MLLCVSFAFGENLKIAVGAGYKKPVTEVLKEYEKTHPKVDAMFGNMAQIFAHASQMEISLVIADKKFLEKQHDLVFTQYQTIGLGKAVLAFAKGIQLSSIEDLAKPEIQKIAMPESKKAIYGDAGIEFLHNAHLYDKVKDKLLIVSTVPQVSAYVVTNEVDVGIINLTAALDNGDKQGGYIEIPSHLYTKIEIVAGSLKSCEQSAQCQSFVSFLSSPAAKEIFTKYGL